MSQGSVQVLLFFIWHLVVLSESFLCISALTENELYHYLRTTSRIIKARWESKSQDSSVIRLFNSL